jgi:hypothetical protein
MSECGPVMGYPVRGCRKKRVFTSKNCCFLVREFPEACVDKRVVFLGESCNGFFADGPCMFSTVIVACGDQIHAGVEQNQLIGFLAVGSVWSCHFHLA